MALIKSLEMYLLTSLFLENTLIIYSDLDPVFFCRF